MYRFKNSLAGRRVWLPTGDGLGGDWHGFEGSDRMGLWEAGGGADGSRTVDIRNADVHTRPIMNMKSQILAML
jgi:hypothetical protein